MHGYRFIVQDEEDIDITLPIDHNNFQSTLARYPIGKTVVVLAKWLSWCNSAAV